ncbi:MAG TPA: GGDEF domain-containing protein [Smithellaceae bacterium]|nr:GGDEF domain-containing protein [Smithellaceae bacterium]
MKPLKKTENSFSGVPPAVTGQEIFQNILGKMEAKNGKYLSGKDQAEVFCILTDDVPSEELSRLIQSKKGITVNLKEDILKRLLKLEKEYRFLKTLSLTDELTGLYNKRFFNRQLKIEITRTRRTGQPFCLMFIDLDNFKSINDSYGHTKGDELLVKLCRLICQKIRPTDFACRYGGDEFTIIMPATYLIDGLSIAQRWHDLIKQVAAGMGLNISSSIGIDEFDVSCKLTAEEFLDRVDRELYRAKNTGKNKISAPTGHRRVRKPETRAVTPAEKNALYKTPALLPKRKKTAGKGKK